MKRVPADEFARHAAEYLEGSEIVSVEKDGEVIGQYVPVPNGHTSNGTGPQTTSRRYGDLSEAELLRELEKGLSPEDLARIRKIDETMRAIYDRAGMTEEEFAAYFDMTKPFPYDLDPNSPSNNERGKLVRSVSVATCRDGG